MKIILAMCIFGLVISVLPFNAYAQPTVGGACCFPNGACSHSNDEFDCEEGIGNIYQGDGTFCEPNPCQQEPSAIPTMTEWGMIIFVVLAALGSVYYMRRQKTAKS
jgi:hypothetical protein